MDGTAPKDKSNVLEVHNLKTRFHTQDGTIHAVNGVSFELREGELLGIVGESGCGKSVTVMSLLKLIPIPPGEIEAGKAYFSGQDLISLDDDALRKIRGYKIGFIFQDPMTSLNPVLTIGQQIMEPLRTHLGMSREEAKARAIKLLELIGIPLAKERLSDYPHQFSGGMRQRVMIAIALSCNPQILIADEPTTALDVTIQAQIIDLVKELRKELGMSIIWITHDLGVVAGIADRVMVMYGGFLVEKASCKACYLNPSHPYTQGLLGSLPRLEERSVERLTNIKGQPPNLLSQPEVCPFAPRCPYVFEQCLEENPTLFSIGGDHEVACWWDVENGVPRNGR
jgi:oligopeptide/dipeptide ABC transporter ATP-binding protein